MKRDGHKMESSTNNIDVYHDFLVDDVDDVNVVTFFMDFFGAPYPNMAYNCWKNNGCFCLFCMCVFVDIIFSIQSMLFFQLPEQK